MPFQTTLRPLILRLHARFPFSLRRQARWHHRQEVRAAERELQRLTAEYEKLHAQWPAPDPAATLALTTRLARNDQAWLRVMTRLQRLQLPIS